MLDPLNSLGLVIQVSITLAGFAGLITTVNLHHWNERQSTWLFFQLSTSFGALFQGCVPMVFLHAGFPEPILWACCSAVWLVVTLAARWKALQAIKPFEQGGEKITGSLTKVVINTSLWAMAALQVYNLVLGHAFWPVLAAIMWMFALSCLSFTAMLYSAIENR